VSCSCSGSLRSSTPGLPLARLTADKLDQVGVLGPFKDTSEGSPRYTFVPDRGILQGGAFQGWVIGVLPTQVRVRYSWGGQSISPGQWSDSLWDDEGAMRLLRASAGFDRLLVMRFSTPSTWTWIAQLRSTFGTPEDPWPPDYDFKGYVQSQGAFSPMIANVVGVSLYPADPFAPSQLQLRFLAPSGGGATYGEGEATFEAFGPPYLLAPFLVPSPAVTGLPSPIDRSSFYHYSPATGYSYLSVATAEGGYTTYRWDGSTAIAATLPLSNRVDAVLSTGRLFSRDEEEGFVYDASGERLARFPMGDLDFVGEYWDSSESRFRMVFALPVRVGGGEDSDPELSLEVYSLPTSDVTDLEP